jgi:hypothetical protein
VINIKTICRWRVEDLSQKRDHGEEKWISVGTRAMDSHKVVILDKMNFYKRQRQSRDNYAKLNPNK